MPPAAAEDRAQGFGQGGAVVVGVPDEAVEGGLERGGALFPARDGGRHQFGGPGERRGFGGEAAAYRRRGQDLLVRRLRATAARGPEQLRGGAPVHGAQRAGVEGEFPAQPPVAGPQVPHEQAEGALLQGGVLVPEGAGDGGQHRVPGGRIAP